MTGQEHDHDGVGGHRPADVGEVDAQQLEPPGVPDVEAQRQGQAAAATTARAHRRRCSRSRLGMPVRALPARPVRQEREERLHVRRLPRGRAPTASAGACRPTSSPSTTNARMTEPDGAQVDLRVEVGLQALGDELAQATEAVAADDGGDRHEADRRHRGHADAGHDERHREGQLDAQEAASRPCSPWRRPPRGRPAGPSAARPRC